MRLENNRKAQMVFCVSSMVVLFGIYLLLSTWIDNHVERKKILNREIVADNNVLVDIVSVTNSERNLAFGGWLVHLNTEFKDIRVVLSPLGKETAKNHVLETSLEQCAELHEYKEYLNVKDSEGRGFVAEIDKDKLTQDICYEIQAYVNYDLTKGQGVKVFTKEYLYNGQLYSYNPLEFVTPAFSDEKMTRVVEDGYLLGYNMRFGAWVYQYEGNLYWILDKRIEKNTNDNIYMFYHLYTSNAELLPENRRQNGFDNRDFMFEANELEIEEEYRVARVELESEYPVSYILTGHYADGKNLWKVRNRVEMHK